MSNHRTATIGEQGRILAEAMLRIRADRAEGRGDVEKLDRDLAVLTDMLIALSDPAELHRVLMDPSVPYRTRVEAAYELDAIQTGAGLSGTQSEAMRRALSDLDVMARAIGDGEAASTVWSLAERYGVVASIVENRKDSTGA
ncbi:hypothetical protein [Spirillospora sp. CA-128828]|uniref:hypothetical protein n=1 Tax=Spirillospora sp. CA-128828 TaxID=3240033 RepID=UPI003D900C49